MSAVVIDPSAVAAQYRTELRGALAEFGTPLKIVGLLTQREGAAATYAQHARRGCADVGIDAELRQVEPRQVEDEVRRANADPDVHGLFLYYPLTDPDEDRWVRELVDPRKDVEGMHSFWSRLLYENRRYLDAEQLQQAILPCTPLAILKLLEHAGLRGSSGEGPGRRLRGVTACVINRSDIVGRPLSAMLANDGARVISIDLDGSLLFEPAINTHAHVVRDTDIDRAAALAQADVVITGVPSRAFDVVRAEEIKAGAICVNVSQFKNFADDITERASAFVPRVGPMTVTMAMRNLLRLHRTVQHH